ncbi:heavy-metal-associated domain-containing protein [Streptomyces sp. NPDC091412]|uniref:heavy-metal-associated domain-containing protein n=1 Tax=Streptomyces sp. NPDC091412 TaxID=3366002 RepID=UPI003829EB56
MQPSTHIASTTFEAEDTTRAHCRRAVTEQIAAIDSVGTVTNGLAAGTVTVIASRPLDRADIAAAVDKAGHALVP